jgi:peptide/nickel transport system permease protein/microcin C transport system permease protein
MLIPTLIGVLTLTFLVTQFVPGGPIDVALHRIDLESGAKAGAEGGAEASGFNYTGRKGIDQAQVEQLKHQFGFDVPVWQRYVGLLERFLRFDLGESYFRGQKVVDLIRSKFLVSMSLGLWTFLLSYTVSIPLGVAKAARAGTPFDVASSLVILVGYALPGFVLGVLLILLFGGGSFWDIFPLRGLTSENWSQLSWFDRVKDYVWHVTLPVIASVVGTFAIKTLLTRNTMLEELQKQYVLTARAKGLSERQVFWKHAFRNALLPMITGFPTAFITAFFTGSLLIETLFSLDGLGLLSFESISNRDYPVVLGSLYAFTLVALLTKLFADLAYVLADPRVAYDAQPD